MHINDPSGPSVEWIRKPDTAYIVGGFSTVYSLGLFGYVETGEFGHLDIQTSDLMGNARHSNSHQTR